MQYAGNDIYIFECVGRIKRRADVIIIFDVNDLSFLESYLNAQDSISCYSTQ